jgi:hypothetical protein
LIVVRQRRLTAPSKEGAAIITIGLAAEAPV